MRGSFVWAAQLAALFISNQACDVAYWHLADNPAVATGVRFWTIAAYGTKQRSFN